MRASPLRRGLDLARRPSVALLVSALFAGVGLAGQAEGPHPQLLRLGVMVEEPADPGRIIGFYSDVVSQLRSRLAPEGIRVPGIVIAKDLEDLSRRLRDGEVDIVIETVFASQLLRDRSGGQLEPALALVRGGQREYQSVFFTRSDSEVAELADLQGRTLVLEAERSTSAFALPRAELARHGLRLTAGAGGDGQVRYVLAGAELNQAIWVAQGRGEAGAFSDGDWDAVPAPLREQLRIFHRSGRILRGLLSFRSDLAPRVRERSAQLLMHLHEDPEGLAALEKARITRFEPLTDSDRADLVRWGKALRSTGSSP